MTLLAKQKFNLQNYCDISEILEENINVENSSSIFLGFKLLTLGQSQCYITAHADIIASHFILSRDLVANAIKTNAKIFNLIVNLKDYVIQKIASGDNKIVNLLVGKTMTKKEQWVDEDGKTVSESFTNKIDPKIISRVLFSNHNPETNISIYQESLIDNKDAKPSEKVIPILSSRKREIRIIPKTVEQNILKQIYKDPQQTNAYEKIRNSKDRINVLHGAYRAGKSYVSSMLAIERIHWLLNKDLKELNEEFGSDVQEKGAIVFIGKSATTIYNNILQGFFKNWKICNLPPLKSTSWRLSSCPDQEIILASYTNSGQSIKGLTVALMIVDELDALEEKTGMWDLMISRLSCPWSKMISTHNPKHELHFTSKLLNQENITQSHFSLLKCSFADQSYVKMLSDSYREGSAKYNKFILGNPSNDNQGIYNCFNLNKHTYISEIDYKKYFKIVVGYDHGMKSPSPYVMCGLYLDEETTKIEVLKTLYYGYGHSDRLELKHYISDLKAFLKDDLGNDIKVDAIYCPHDAIEHRKVLKETGGFNNIYKASQKKGVKDGILLIQNLLMSGRLQINSVYNPELLDEMVSYSWKNDESREEVIKLHDHCLDALRYALVSVELENNDWIQDVENVL